MKIKHFLLFIIFFTSCKKVYNVEFRGVNNNFPFIAYKMTDTIGLLDGDSNDLNWANHLLNKFNGENGASKQIKTFIFTFYNESCDVADLQRKYLKGGNKNEVIICVGYDCCKPTWIRAFSWTDEKICVNEAVRFYNPNMKLYELVGHMSEVWKTNWKRKEFNSLNDLINIEPSSGAWYFNIIFTIILVCVLTIFFTKNEFNEII